MAVVTRGDAIGCPGCLDLLQFGFPIVMAGFRKPGLQETATAATAVIVGAVGVHIDNVFFSNDGFQYKSEVFRNRISKALSHQLARILNSELNLQVFVPIRAYLQFPFPDPLRVVLNDTFNFKIIRDVEFLQSDPDCEQFVPSLRIKPHLAPKVVDRLRFNPNDMLPGIKVLAEEAVVFGSPAFCTVSPVGVHRMEDFP